MPEDLELDENQRRRIMAACRALGTTYREFIVFSALAAADEVLADVDP